MKRSRSAPPGFTLIELMLVVAIVGVLSVLAIYGVRKYTANSKTAEATNSVGQMARDAALAYEREGMQGTVLSVHTSSNVSRHFCSSASASIAASKSQIAGRKYQSKEVEWNVDAPKNGGFACLKFSMDAPQYYMYSYAVTGTGAPGDSFTATAQGDLNGDGVLSLYQLTGSVTATRAVDTQPNITIVRPED